MSTANCDRCGQVVSLNDIPHNCDPSLIAGKYKYPTSQAQFAQDQLARGASGVVAQRNPVDYRYDLLDKRFFHLVAQIAHYGAEKYGDKNWQKSRLVGGKSPINHIYDHLRQYDLGMMHDKFQSLGHQLAAIAFNAMMEFYYLENIDAGKER